MTLTQQVHVLPNAEFFAPGQAYVALSRLTKLTDLHLWCLDMSAFKASPAVDRAYEGLRHPARAC